MFFFTFVYTFPFSLRVYSVYCLFSTCVVLYRAWRFRFELWCHTSHRVCTLRLMIPLLKRVLKPLIIYICVFVSSVDVTLRRVFFLRIDTFSLSCCCVWKVSRFKAVWYKRVKLEMPSDSLGHCRGRRERNAYELIIIFLLMCAWAFFSFHTVLKRRKKVSHTSSNTLLQSSYKKTCVFVNKYIFFRIDDIFCFCFSPGCS